MRTGIATVSFRTLEDARDGFFERMKRLARAVTFCNRSRIWDLKNFLKKNFQIQFGFQSLGLCDWFFDWNSSGLNYHNFGSFKRGNFWFGR